MRRLARAAPTAFAILLIAGCGAAESSSEAVADSANKTAQAGTSRLRITFDEVVTMSGAFDYESGTGVFAQNKGMPDTIWTSKAVFVSIDAYAPIDIKGKRWIETNLVLGTTPLFQPFAGSPSELLTFVRAAGDVENVETGSERGVSVTRYRARLDLERALEELPGDERDLMRATIKQYWPEGTEGGLPVELAIDGEGRLRKVSMPIPEESRLTLEFYDYGVEVDAKAPPPEQVMSWEEFHAAMKDHCAGADEKGLGDSDEAAACTIFGGWE